MRNIFRELIEKEKKIIDLSNELSQTKELLNFSLDKQEELEKEIEGLKQKFSDDLDKLEKPLYENHYNKLEVKFRIIKELVKDLKKELAQ